MATPPKVIADGLRRCAVKEWIYFVHPLRGEPDAAMPPEEEAAWEDHFTGLLRLLDEGEEVFAGPRLGRVHTGAVVFEASDEAAAQRIMADDPVIKGGYAWGELRPYERARRKGRVVR